jgi:hypothetical protein
MQGNTPIPVVEELAVLVERAERACKTTAQLVRDFNFIVVWYQSRPRSRLRADPILDETRDQEQTQDSPSDPSISQEYSLSHLNAPEHRGAHPRAPSVRA